MSFGQDLYLMGAINETAYAHTGNPAYLAAAQKYYEEGVALGPNRPQSLYGLFDCIARKEMWQARPPSARRYYRTGRPIRALKQGSVVLEWHAQARCRGNERVWNGIIFIWHVYFSAFPRNRESRFSGFVFCRLRK